MSSIDEKGFQKGAVGIGSFAKRLLLTRSNIRMDRIGGRGRKCSAMFRAGLFKITGKQDTDMSILCRFCGKYEKDYISLQSKKENQGRSLLVILSEEKGKRRESVEMFLKHKPSGPATHNSSPPLILSYAMARCCLFSPYAAFKVLSVLNLIPPPSPFSKAKSNSRPMAPTPPLPRPFAPRGRERE